MELEMTMPQETKEYIDNLIKDEIEKVKAQIVEEGEKIKRDYIPRTDVVKFKAHIIEYHTDEEGRHCINCEDGCEEWAGCPCVYYKAESEAEDGNVD